MEAWQLDFEWLRVRTQLKDILQLDKLPDFQGTMFLIGLRELGVMKDDWTKEEKQDLMHIAVCRLLEDEGFYAFEGIDADGWPHWKLLKPVPEHGVKSQETFLIERIIRYVDAL
jgi:hypothetical protein